MSRGLMGKKLGMTNVFVSDGTNVPVTVIEAGPCVVTQIKTEETDGYNAIQLSFGERKAKNVTKPLQGHFSKAGDRCFQYVKEFKVDNPDQFEVGQEITVDMFNVGDYVDVIGYIKGRGFAGVIKRHGFGGGRMTHGGKAKRIPGSVGNSAWPSRVVKGRKLPGHYGNTRQTTKHLEIIDVRPEDNLILLKGPVPGASSNMVMINKSMF